MNRRARALLLLAVALLLAMLGVLGYSFWRIVTPPGVAHSLSSTDVPPMTWVRSIYGFGPAADQQLYSPTSVAFGPDGAIYATDPVRSRIMVFNPDGTFRRLVHTGAGATGKGMLKRPESIAVDSAGNLYVADSLAGKILVFGRTGSFLREWPVQMQARGVSVNDGRVYVLDVGRVLVFDTQGQLVNQFGARGRGLGQIDAYQGIVSDGRRIYVADAFNHRVEAFDQAGQLLWAYPSKVPTSGPDLALQGGAAASPFDLPQDLTIDGRGRLVVIDAFNFSAMVLDPNNGHVLSAYGDAGHNDGEFFYPSSIAYDRGTNRFAVADTNNNRVQIVELPGSGAVLSPRRVLTSPWRYLLPALALLLALFVLLAWWAVRAWIRRSRDGRGEATVTS